MYRTSSGRVGPLGFAKPDATVPERAFILMNAGLCPSSKGLPKVYLTSPWDEYVHDHIMHPLGNPPTVAKNAAPVANASARDVLGK